MNKSTHKKREQVPRVCNFHNRYWNLHLFIGSLVFVFFTCTINAQTTLNATGGTATISGNVYSYSIGEMVLVSTKSTSDNYFTQGVLQNDDVNLKVYDNHYLSKGLELYPNPVANILYLQPSFSVGGKLSLQLYDFRGRLIMDYKIELSSGTEKQQMNLSILQEGTYLLQASLEQDGQVYRHSFKIIKFSDQ